jgi:hypothetical protein
MASPGLFQWAFGADLDEGRGLRWRGLCKTYARHPRLGAEILRPNRSSKSRLSVWF